MMFVIWWLTSELRRLSGNAFDWFKLIIWLLIFYRFVKRSYSYIVLSWIRLQWLCCFEDMCFVSKWYQIMLRCRRVGEVCQKYWQQDKNLVLAAAGIIVYLKCQKAIGSFRHVKTTRFLMCKMKHLISYCIHLLLFFVAHRILWSSQEREQRNHMEISFHVHANK